ncbi:MAG: CooT family nickel-binding protein [Candidatus Thermoplasmatota archaeon]|nr:CooT family nickel-binding protein [Candidatus Thermoplasmatota archaeon]
MCESTVYLMKGSVRVVVMSEAARIIVNNDGITCIDMLGERKEVPQVKIVDANLVKHEIILKPRSG